MFNIRDEIARALSERLAIDIDAALREQIDDRLGAGQWTIDSLRGRLCVVTSAGWNGAQRWTLDGLPLMDSAPIEPADLDGRLVSASLKIRRIDQTPYRSVPPADIARAAP